MSSIDRAGVFTIIRDQLSEILEIEASAISEGQSFSPTTSTPTHWHSSNLLKH